MRSYNPAEMTYLQSREGYVAKALLWFAARNRTTNAVETMGLWTGDDDAIFNIDGTLRTYLGAGSIIGVDPITMSTGLVVRSQRIRLASFPDEVQRLILEYDLGLAPAEIHRAFFSPETGALIAAPHRLWKGFVDRAPVPIAAIDGDSPAELTLVSAARALTRGLTLTHSTAVQRQRDGDQFLKYASIGGVVRTPWGATMPSDDPPKPAPRPRVIDWPDHGR